MDYGKKAESDVAKLCGDLFLKDFVLRPRNFELRVANYAKSLMLCCLMVMFLSRCRLKRVSFRVLR